MTASRVCLVTGGAGGIGAAVCRSLAAAGHHVAVADLGVDSARGLAAAISGAAVACDVTSADSVAAAFAEVRTVLGNVEICVNCAGWDELRPFLDTDEEFSRKVLAINLEGTIRVVRHCLPAMREAGWGRIVNIASDAGRVGSSLESVYSAAKGGVIAFTKTVAREFARYGITANNVCPGPTDTALLRTMAEAGHDSGKLVGALTKAIPMRRLGAPEDVAAAVAYLAGEEAAFVTGQTLSVSGGLTMA